MRLDPFGLSLGDCTYAVLIAFTFLIDAFLAVII
jgi:hypothetical protein